MPKDQKLNIQHLYNEMKTLANYLMGMAIIAMISSCDQQSKIELSKLQEQSKKEEANMETVKSFFDYLDNQDTSALGNIIGKDFAFYFGSYEQPMSHDQLLPLIKGVYSGFPDFKHEIEIIFASGDYVTSKQSYSGTHTNNYMGIEPTGKKITYKGIFIFKLKDGMITDVHGMEDDLAELIKASR